MVPIDYIFNRNIFINFLVYIEYIFNIFNRNVTSYAVFDTHLLVIQPRMCTVLSEIKFSSDVRYF